MKIEPHFKCLEGEHVFIPCYTKGNTRDLWITEFVCQHCLGKVDTRTWQIHLKKLEDYAKAVSTELETHPDSPIQGTSSTSSFPLAGPTTGYSFADAPIVALDDMPPPKKKKR